MFFLRLSDLVSIQSHILPLKTAYRMSINFLIIQQNVHEKLKSILKQKRQIWSFIWVIWHILLSFIGNSDQQEHMCRLPITLQTKSWKIAQYYQNHQGWGFNINTSTNCKRLTISAKIFYFLFLPYPSHWSLSMWCSVILYGAKLIACV